MPNKKIPLRHFRQIRKLYTVHDKQYVFMVQNNISLAFVDEEDVGAILQIRNACCGPNTSKKVIAREATEAEVRVWHEGGRM